MDKRRGVGINLNKHGWKIWLKSVIQRYKSSGNCFLSHQLEIRWSLCRYLLDETINFHTVTMAKSTLHAAHQYLCPGLIRLIVEFLERNLTPISALEIYEGLALYANHISWDPNWSSNSPTAPPAPGDDAAEIGIVAKLPFYNLDNP